MSIAAVAPTSSSDSEYGVRVQKLAQDEQKVEGEAAVELIETAKPAPVGVNGEGSLVNRYA